MGGRGTVPRLRYEEQCVGYGDKRHHRYRDDYTP
jgi:hypothetical protein